MAIVKEGILFAKIKSNSTTGITIGSSNVNLMLTEGCRISVYNVSIFNFLNGALVKSGCSDVRTSGASFKFRGPRLLLRLPRKPYQYFAPCNVFLGLPLCSVSTALGDTDRAHARYASGPYKAHTVPLLPVEIAHWRKCFPIPATPRLNHAQAQNHAPVFALLLT